jgi:CRP-like cAMP-binding protein/Fe-S-cluster-containing hydrogenase component 2
MAGEYFADLQEEVEHEVMACIGCNDCMLACPLPEKQYVTISQLNFGVLEDTLTDPAVIQFVQACTQCQQCVPVCPADLHRADMVLWNKLKVENVQPNRYMPLMIGNQLVENSGWTLDGLATQLSELPLFAGVEVSHLRRTLLSVTLRQLAPGETLVKEGEFHERLYVVVAGGVEQQAAGTSRDHTRILVLGPGSFHGEMAVMGNQQEPFTIVAVAQSVVVELPKAAVFRLMRESASFKATMDEMYRRRALWTQARTSPLLAALPEATVEDLLGRASFRVLRPGELIYREGDPPSDLYLVRTGFVRVARHFGEGERVLQYFREGDVFGATAILFDQPQSTTTSASTRTEIVVIPGRAVAEMLGHDTTLKLRLTEEAVKNEQIVLNLGTDLRPPPRDSSSSQIMSIEGLLDQGVVQGHEILVIDTAICTNCNNCVDGCERRHGYSRIQRSGLQLGNLLFPTACRHCEDPVCLLCSVNGIVREPDGEIRIVPDNCIGCGACAERCPYDNIQMHDREKPSHSAVFDLLSLLPGVGTKRSKGTQRAAEHERERIAVKCDLCAGYEYYACVHACPVGAAMRIDPVAAFGRSDLVIGMEMKKQQAAGNAPRASA